MWSRRAFLGASSALGAVAAARPRGLDAMARASQAAAPDDPESAVRDERYWREIRRAFARDPRLINLNNGNSSPSPRMVHDALVRHLNTSNLLPVHYRGVLEQTFGEVRRQLALEFGCDAEELALTRNATEALHIAQAGLDLEPGDEVITTDQDYPRMLWAWDQRVRRDRIVLTRIQFPVPTTDDALVERFEQALTPRTRVLHFCHVTNVTGQLFPVRALCRLARARGIVTIVDGAQAAAHVPFALRALECDFYGTSLHKWLMAPHGTGFLYVRRERIAGTWPLQAAHASQQGTIQKFEEIGTQAAAARAAIPDALAFHRAIGAERKAARLRYLTLRWARALEAHPRVRMLSNLDPGQTWGLATMGVDGMSAPQLAQWLFERHGVVVSAMVSQGRPGPVFEFEGIRVTPQVYTSVDEIDRFIEGVEDAIQRGGR